MRVAVLVKYCADPANIYIDQAKGTVDFSKTPKKLSESDLSAVEAAVRLKEGYGGEVNVFSYGHLEATRLLRETVAMGANKAYLIHEVSQPSPDQHGIAYILAKALEKYGPYDIILAGHASEDRYAGAVGPLVASELGLQQLCYANKLEVADGDVLRIERILDDRVEIIEATVPVLVTVLREICQPRMVSSLQVMRVPKDAVVTVKLDELGISNDDIAKRALTIQNELSLVKKERKRIIIEGEKGEVAEKLLQMLKGEGVI